MKLVRFWGVILLCLMMFTACEQKMLCFDHSKGSVIFVSFDWSQSGNEMDHSLMTVYFYADDQKNPYKFFISGNGGKVRLPAGVYNVLCYNDDVEEFFVNEEDGFYGVLGFTKVLEDIKQTMGGDTGESGSIEETPIEIGPTIASPGKLVTGQNYSFVVNEEDDEQTLVLVPKVASCYYSCTFLRVENKKYLSSIRCSLSGLVKGIRLYDGTPTDETADMLFPMEYQKDVLYGETVTFGSLPGKHGLFVTLTLNDGSQRQLYYDVTEQVNNAPDPHRVAVVIDELIVPKTDIESGGGFSADVGGWNDWTIEVDMRK
jgi:hypothetical protein